MAASILKLGTSQNTNCDNLVGFPKSGHIRMYYYYVRILYTAKHWRARFLQIFSPTVKVFPYIYVLHASGAYHYSDEMMTFTCKFSSEKRFFV